MITVASKRTGAKGEYVGRPSILGNPFVVGKHGKQGECVEYFREWIEERIALGDERILRELERLRALAQQGDLTLVCWCAPLRCHADVIKNLLEESF